MTFKEFIKSKTFRVNALAAVGITILLIVLNMLALRIYTDHGDSVEIPDLKGKSTSEVADILEDIDLRFQIRDSVFTRETPPGTVLDQYPKPGMKVKENRTVFITLCAVSQEMIPMPQLTDISYRQAINLIESSGLIAGNVEYKPSEFPNLVLEQKIAGQIVPVGERIPKGSVVDLILGSDSNGETSEVPTLFGRNLAEARLTLGEAFLNVGNITYDESVLYEMQKGKAYIFKQSPDPSEVFEVPHGTAIDIWLTIDKEKLKAKPEEEKPENSFF
ncbi:MAG: PASTA domain-containing protein [Prolixibacteraceae bacterium]|nr:PASTA domain-containing protein [Prolixibacteraceae bacterium]